MAAKLQCEICGGKLIGRPGGIYECDSCGMEYDTAWAKAKIQEITGTVKVEGTVEVAGKVQIEGPVKVEGGANKEALLQRGQMALEECKWDEARERFNQVLGFDPKNAGAYLGLALAEAECRDKSEYAQLYIAAGSSIRENRYVRRAGELDGEIASWLAKLDAQSARSDAEAKERLAQFRKRISPAATIISAGPFHAVGLKTDGTVVAAGSNNDGECNVGDWRNVISVAAGLCYTVGLKTDGTVVAVGNNGYCKCDVQDWRDIVSICAGSTRTVGVTSDGKVVTTVLQLDAPDEYDKYGNYKQCQAEIRGWRDIIDVCICGDYTVVGLKSDGTVVASGENDFGQTEVGSWRDIVGVSAGSFHTVGLKADGTILAVGNNEYGQCNVRDWRNVVAISAGREHTIGLKLDGTVVATGNNSDGQCDVKGWRSIVGLSAGEYYSVGLKEDGTIVSVGELADGLNRVNGWKLFDNIGSIEIERQNAAIKAEAERRAAAEKDEAERKAGAERAEAERKAKIAALNKEKVDLQAELPTIKGLFSGGKRRQVEARLAEIEEELKKLG